jgi:hypothetical protein
MAGDKGVSCPTMGDLLSYSLQSIDSILCKSFHAHHPVHLLPRSLSIARKNLECSHFDIKNAFTESYLKENVGEMEVQ